MKKDPVGLVGPVGPIGPVGPMGPVCPVGPVGPVVPVGPVCPVCPSEPLAPWCGSSNRAYLWCPPHSSLKKRDNLSINGEYEYSKLLYKAMEKNIPIRRTSCVRESTILNQKKRAAGSKRLGKTSLLNPIKLSKLIQQTPE